MLDSNIFFVGLHASAQLPAKDSPTIDTTRVYNIDEAIVTANTFSDVITAQKLSRVALKKPGSLSVADAVRYFAGVQIKDYGGVGGLKTADVRNMGTNHMEVFCEDIQLDNARNVQIDTGKV